MTLPFEQLRLAAYDVVILPIVGAAPDGPFILKGVDGLGPPEREVKIARTIREGGVRQGTRTANRQLVMRIGLQPDYDTGQTSADLRNLLYGFLVPPAQQALMVQVYGNGSWLCKTEGDISRFEPALFSKDPEVQITVECDYPYLLNPTPFNQVPSKSVAGSWTNLTVLNDGDAPAGFYLKFTLSGAQSGDLIIGDDFGPGEKLQIGGTWNSGDTAIVDTRDGQRGVWRIPSGGSTPVSRLGELTGSSTWFQMLKGNNTIKVNNTSINVTTGAFQHTPAYWGV